MRIDIMTDIETLGTDSDSTIIQIAAVAFDITTGKIHTWFNQTANIHKNEGPLKVTAGTLKWWMKTNPELLRELLDGEHSSEDMLRNFHDWLGQFKDEDMYLWGNGILFDNKMIQHQFESIGLNYPIFYRNDRDVRTILELASQKMNQPERTIRQFVTDMPRQKELVKHNAIDDCHYQIDLVRYCYNTLMEGSEKNE